MLVNCQLLNFHSVKIIVIPALVFYAKALRAQKVFHAYEPHIHGFLCLNFTETSESHAGNLVIYKMRLNQLKSQRLTCVLNGLIFLYPDAP